MLGNWSHNERRPRNSAGAESFHVPESEVESSFERLHMPHLLLRTMVALAPRQVGSEPPLRQVSALDRQLAALGFLRRDLLGQAIVWEREVLTKSKEKLRLAVAFEPESKDFEPSPEVAGEFYIVAWSGTVLNPPTRVESPKDREEHRRILFSELGDLFYVGSIDYAYRVNPG